MRLCVALMATTDAVIRTIGDCEGVAFDATLACLASGSSDDGRSVASAVRRSLSNATYVDDAHCGPQSALARDAGRLFASCDGGVDALDPVGEGGPRVSLGEATFRRGIGAAARAGLRRRERGVRDVGVVTAP